MIQALFPIYYTPYLALFNHHHSGVSNTHNFLIEKIKKLFSTYHYRYPYTISYNVLVLDGRPHLNKFYFTN